MLTCIYNGILLVLSLFNFAGREGILPVLGRGIFGGGGETAGVGRARGKSVPRRFWFSPSILVPLAEFCLPR